MSPSHVLLIVHHNYYKPTELQHNQMDLKTNFILLTGMVSIFSTLYGSSTTTTIVRPILATYKYFLQLKQQTK